MNKEPARPDPVQDHLAAVVAALSALSLSAVQSLLLSLREAQTLDRRVYTFGNGGSAATAAHFAVDLRKAGVCAWALTEPAYVTAQGNDSGFETVFARQVEQVVRPLDVVVAISVSGRSPNVLMALHVARLTGARTVLLAGRDGPCCGADVVLLVPSADYGVVEDAHLAVCHAVARALREEAEHA